MTVTVRSSGPPTPDNNPPVADAGPDQVVVDEDRSGSEAVVLNGSRSYDPDEGDSIVSYQWLLGQTLLHQSSSPFATVILPLGVHAITLVVRDTHGARDQASVQVSIVTPPNQTRVAVAGPDQTHVDTDHDGVHRVTLDASGSCDPDGTIVTYLWLAGPPGDQYTLISAIEPVVEVTLPVGTHELTLIVTDNDGESASDTLTVTILAAGPALTVTSASNLTSAGNPGGPFDPASLAYTLKNEGGQALHWTAAKTQSWVSLSATSGTLADGATATVTASINTQANSLASGSHSDTLTFTNTTNGAGNTTRAVALTVNPPPGALAVTPTRAYAPAGIQGGPFSRLQWVYTLRNTGDQPLNWSVAKTTNWLTLSSPTSGTLAAGAETTITLSINSNALALSAGIYSDTLTFTNTTDGSGNTTRAVALTVNPPPGVLAVSRADALTSSGIQGGPFRPASRAYTLSNTGGQSLNWSASKTRTWVTLSPTSGTLAPGAQVTFTVLVNSNANGLAAGIYSDIVSVTNTTSGSGSTTRSVMLSIVASSAPRPGVRHDD